MSISRYVIEARGLSVGYADDTILENLELSLRQGETLALVGANGSGKSTLLKAIAGLIPPLRGHLSVLGAVPLAKPASVSYLGQFHPSAFVLPLRASEVVGWALRRPGPLRQAGAGRRVRGS